MDDSRFISKGIVCMETWNLEGILLLTNTNNLFLVLVTSNQKGFLIPGNKNWLSGNEKSSFVLAIVNMSKLLSTKLGMLKNLFQVEFILRYPSKINLVLLNLSFPSSLLMHILLHSDWSGKLFPVVQTQYNYSKKVLAVLLLPWSCKCCPLVFRSDFWILPLSLGSRFSWL